MPTMLESSSGPPQSRVDDSVIERAVNGAGDALAQIYDAYSKDIYRYHYSRVGNSADAEELTAQTFMAVVEALPRYQARGKFSAWIFQIARHKAMDHFRRQHLKPLEIPPDISYPDDILDQVAKRQSYDRLVVLMQALRPDERELIRLRYTAQLSLTEIGQLMGRSEDAVRKWLKRLLEKLSSQMEVENA